MSRLDMFLSDGVVGLRPIEREDLQILAEWRNDPMIRARTREFRPLSMSNQERWFERVTAPDRRDFMFVVCERLPADGFIGDRAYVGEGLRPIGVVGLCYWDQRNRTCEVSFYIGDRSARGKGRATAALALLHRYGFDEIGLDRIWAECYDFNEPGLRTLRRLGYTEEGKRRAHVFHAGRRHDAVLFGLLRDEWAAGRVGLCGTAGLRSDGPEVPGESENEVMKTRSGGR